MIGVASFAHDGFWACMDTLKEQKELEEFYAAGNAPWLVWNSKGEH